jgi:hypothetical protein
MFARIFVPSATAWAGTAQRSSSQNHWAVFVFSLSSIRWRRGTGKGGAFIQNPSVLSAFVPDEERKKASSFEAVSARYERTNH